MLYAAEDKLVDGPSVAQNQRLSLAMKYPFVNATDGLSNYNRIPNHASRETSQRSGNPRDRNRISLLKFYLLELEAGQRTERGGQRDGGRDGGKYEK